MVETHYGKRIIVALPFEEALARTTESLKAQGFGVLTSIDVRATMKEKLNVDFRRYVILGACNPPLAYRALQAEPEIGLLLPCNVVVYEESASSSVIAAMAPRVALGIVGDNPDLAAVAHEADARITAVLNQLNGA